MFFLVLFSTFRLFDNLSEDEPSFIPGYLAPSVRIQSITIDIVLTKLNAVKKSNYLSDKDLGLNRTKLLESSNSDPTTVAKIVNKQ